MSIRNVASFEALFSIILNLFMTPGLDFHVDQPAVEISDGTIQGQILTTIQEPHLEYYAFMGIPYAKPPIGKLRFMPPLKPEPWTDIKKCENFGDPCPQISKTDGSAFGKEDCLTLNVFTNQLNTSDLRPVMFWIHGGAHIRGSSSKCGPDYLIEKEIVLVTINYRLNIFGFLTVNDANAYGNAGLKDQVAALEWVQDNIAKFGGDPSRVTIFGQSSGSDSASLLQLSPRTEGLFHQIIGESGSPLNPRYLQRNPLKYVHNIAKYFNICTDTTKDIVEGLQKIDFVELTKAANSSEVTGYETKLEAMPFYPIMEAENSDAIITQSPYKLLQTGNFNKVPFVFGYNTNEGSLGLKIVNSEMKIEDFDTNYTLFAPQSLDNRKDGELIGKTVRDFFLGNSSAKRTEKFLKFLGQELLVRGIRKGIDFQKTYSHGYFYKFSYKGTHTTEYYGVGHTEELQYLFVTEGTTENLTEKDITTRKRMVLMWTNFATFGSPIPKNDSLMGNAFWKKCDNKSSVNFLDIGDDLLPGTDPDNKEYQFWEELFAYYGITPTDTY